MGTTRTTTWVVGLLACLLLCLPPSAKQNASSIVLIFVIQKQGREQWSSKSGGIAGINYKNNEVRVL